MRVAIVSDIHGNKQAFQAVIAAAEADGADELWCLGDLVGYGAEPDACVALAHAPLHDLPRRQPRPGGRRRALARRLLARRARSRRTGRARSSRPRRASTCSRCRRRAAARASGCSTPPRATRSGSTSCRRWRPSCASTPPTSAISFIGHSHVALSFHRAEGEPATGTTRKEGDEVDLRSGDWLINPGSTGQPRDGDAARRVARCSTPTRGRRRGGAPSTTSRAPRRRSGRRTCPTRWPSGSQYGQ